MRITEEAIVAIQYILIQENIEDFFFRVGIEGNELKGMGYAVELPISMMKLLRQTVYEWL